MGRTPVKYINRELSWLEFNQRVLDEAGDAMTPLLSRLMFLAITGSNLDEFFMVRVGGLQLLDQQGSTKADASGMSPQQQLASISARTHRMMLEQYTCYLNELEPALAEAGIRRVRPAELTGQQSKSIAQVFENRIYPVLTPMAVSGRDDFPLLINQTMNVCVHLEAAADGEGPRFAIIPFGPTSSRFITLPSEGGYEYMLLEDAVEMFADRFFPGEQIVECVAFRITRNADLAVREDLASDLLVEMEHLLDARTAGDCVRLEIVDGVTPTALGFLTDTLEVDDVNVYAAPGPVDLGAFMQLSDLPGFDNLRYEPWPPQASPDVDPAGDIFSTVARDDVLLYHPYDSFDPVLRLLEEAAVDPDVLAIKQTLYRTSRNSPIVAALRQAAERGKYVTVIVELKARFDEARNIEWARSLEQAGVQVFYGVKGFKTHSKLCIVVRREPAGIRRYVHFGTGNYNEATARIYSDVSLMTCNEELGADATSFFNAITGYSQPQKFRRIEAAPIGLRERLLEMIQSETQRQKESGRASITAKLNSLVDPKIIDALYEASQAGVPVRLNIRGICCLRPGVEGLSENITVVGVVDRFLEHARIFHFHHGGDERLFISS
ncbi:MAG: polyphosphate kinase 1, partial [Planctomycetaceae bacterium]|nr:polyphosphate kinase 1 [Planctomycetaceae bacterium]